MLLTLTLVTVRFFIISKLSNTFTVMLWIWQDLPWPFSYGLVSMHTTRIVRFFCNYLILYRFINRLKKSTNLHCSIVIATCICQTNPIYFSWIWTIDAICFYFNRSVASIFVSKQVFQLSWIFLQMPPHHSITYHLCILHDREV